MRLIGKIYAATSRDPIRSIEWVIAVMTLIGGIYLFTPLYDVSVAQNGLSAIGQALSHPYMIGLWGATLLVGALFVIYGLIQDLPQFRSMGWFSIVMARIFQLLTTFLVAGPFPITWLYPLTLTLLMIILWALARGEVLGR